MGSLPSIVLSTTLVEEIRNVLGLSGPRDSTMLLLRPEFVKPERISRRSIRVAVSTVVSTLDILLAALTGMMIAFALGAALPVH